VGYAEKRGDHYRGRFKIAPGKYGTVKDSAGATRKFRTRREAEQAANDEEAKIRGGKWKDPAAGQMLLGEYANRWYAGLDLAPSTMQNYRRHLEEHILPEFGERPLAEILRADVDAWERKEAAAGYKPSSIKTWRTTLSVMLADALDGGLIDSNPVVRRRGRGRRAGRKKDRGPEKVTTDELGALLLAERAALLTGRDDEFVAVILDFYTGIRWGELVGLETKYARLGSIRIEWQLYELDTGELLRCPPKDDSYRDVDLPTWLSALLSDHIARTAPRPCSCHGLTYVFRGQRPRLASGRGAATLADVARAAGVSTGTVSTVFNNPDRVAEATRARVENAVAELGFVRGASGPQGGAEHWRRSNFAAWTFRPAASGWYPPKAPHKTRPVPLLAEPWPGVPVRGRNSQDRAEACWTPIAPGLTPHGLRHSHKTLMAELRTPEVLSHDRLGHLLDGIGGRYTHVTPTMRKELCDDLTRRWEASLDARAAMSPRSPPARAQRAAEGPREKEEGRRSQDRLPEFSQRGGPPPPSQTPKEGLTWVGDTGFEPVSLCVERYWSQPREMPPDLVIPHPLSRDRC
jgi:integrase